MTGPLSLESPFVVAPMAGMTDTAFRRLVKRHGGCGLVVTEMVSSEGLVRGIDRTLEYAEYTEEERPVSIQIFGGDPNRMAEAARIVEAMGADVVDVNMGCPVPKIAKHNAGCSLMREPEHAAGIIASMVKAVKIPVTVKMRKGWDEAEANAAELAKRVEGAGAAAITIHGRTAKQSYSGAADWEFVAAVADALSIPCFGSGDCVEPEQVVERLRQGVSGVFVGRGVLRNPWILAQARDLMEGKPARQVSLEDRGRFLLEYVDLLMTERVNEAEGFRHQAPGIGSWESGVWSRGSDERLSARDRRRPTSDARHPTADGRHPTADSRLPTADDRVSRHDRWVINKLRALCAWYTKGFEGGSEFRTAVNAMGSLNELRALIEGFFLMDRAVAACAVSAPRLLPAVR